MAYSRNFFIRQMMNVEHTATHARAWIKDPYVRAMRARLAALRGLYSGKRCFIMGNGPSLRKMDLDRLEGEFVWASNKAYMLFDRIRWRPSFYVSVDTRVVPDIACDIEKYIYTIPGVKCFFPVHFRESQVLSSGSHVYWYHERAPIVTEARDPYEIFTTSPQDWVSVVTTVTIAAMQLAVYLGFNPIYLIGCDTDYKVPDTVKFEGGNDFLLSTENDDPNHFDPAYFGKDSRWHQPKPENMILHYTKARKVCDDLGVQVFNATVGGKLEVFPRVHYMDVLKGAQ